MYLPCGRGRIGQTEEVPESITRSINGLVHGCMRACGRRLSCHTIRGDGQRVLPLAIRQRIHVVFLTGTGRLWRPTSGGCTGKQNTFSQRFFGENLDTLQGSGAEGNAQVPLC